MLGILSFVGFTALVAVISYVATRKTNENTSDGYFLGGRSLTAGVIAGSLLLTNLSTEQIVGLNGSAYQSGLSVMVWETLEYSQVKDLVDGKDIGVPIIDDEQGKGTPPSSENKDTNEGDNAVPGKDPVLA